MALAKGVNSYITVDEADAYLQDRVDVAAWFTADNTARAQALITATSMLDTLPWVGYAVSEAQSLAFPRRGSYFDPRIGYSVNLNEADIPKRILNAVAELAYHLILNDGLLDSSGGIKSLTVGPIQLNDISPVPSIPSFVKRLIKPLQVNSGGNPWWRAN